MAITRTTKGTFQNKATLNFNTNQTALTGVALSAGDTLIIGIAWDVGAVGVATWNGLSMNADASYGSGNPSVCILSLYSAAGGSGDIVIRNSSGFASGARAVWAIAVSGLAPISFDVPSGATGSSATPSDSAISTNQASEILVGCLATTGPLGDLAGTWSNSWSAGQRNGTTGAGNTSNNTVQEGFKIVSAIESSQAALTGITSRAWAICHVTYKALVASLPRPLNINQSVKRSNYF